MMRIHAKKRREIVEIHPGLACSTAVSADAALLRLDDVLVTSPPELSDELLDAAAAAAVPTDTELLESQHVV
jgi:hypothetical protein